MQMGNEHIFQEISTDNSKSHYLQKHQTEVLIYDLITERVFLHQCKAQCARRPTKSLKVLFIIIHFSLSFGVYRCCGNCFYTQDILHNSTTNYFNKINPLIVAATFSFSIHYPVFRNPSNIPTVDISVCYSTFWLQSEFTVSMEKTQITTPTGETACHTSLVSK